RTRSTRLSTAQRLIDSAGVYTGLTAVHPLTGKSIPIYVASYVLEGYGTGAVMGVPAHDSRDQRFAASNNLPSIVVIQPSPSATTSAATKSVASDVFSDSGVLINSDRFNGLTSV